MTATPLQATRRSLGYTADAVMAMLAKRADMLGEAIMSPTSLKTKLSRWENGHEPVSSPVYRRLFRDIYGRTNEELGFPPEHVDGEAEELRARLALARHVDAATVDLFRRQVDQARHVDRRFGGITLLDQLRSQIEQVEGLLRYGTGRGHREELAAVLVEASTLAGWEALDRNAIRQAWGHYERAKAAAREANSVPLLDHATAEQAFVLIDLGEQEAALEQLGYAREMGHDTAGPLLRTWLTAAHGEGYAANGRADEALSAFDEARSLIPTDPHDPALPFVFLGEGHLDRWRGNALARLGDPQSIDELTAALPRLPREFMRARVGMLVDLALAYASIGERDACRRYTQQAKRIGTQIRSDRHLSRLHQLRRIFEG